MQSLDIVVHCAPTSRMIMEIALCSPGGAEAKILLITVMALHSPVGCL